MLYYIEARRFIESVIKQRKLILKDENSRKDIAIMNKYIEELERYLKVHKYDNNLNMAKFFNWQSDKIYALIPGRVDQTKRHADYDLLITRTINILEYAQSINTNAKACKSWAPAIS